MEEIKDQKEVLNFIELIVEEDIRQGKHNGRIHTRFPPEPNGFLHVGHVSAICLNFGLAEKYGGLTNLRFDDTNPSTEKSDYVESMKRDIRWLGFDWGDREYYASDYFDQIYEFAVKLIRDGKAYVDDSTSEEIASMKGTPTEPGVDSPFRSRSPEENLDLFERMKNGEFEDGAKVLRAKIDMAHPNMIMRDPTLYRIKKMPHYRTGDKWCIYPLYDMAHGQSDAIEQITHSICTLEFAPHRALYNWLIENLEIYPSEQIEFARRNLSHTIMSKRKLLKLVNEGYVNGWDDPRMPTISAFRRRGYTPQAIRNFAERIGIAKRENVVDVSFLEYCVREDLNKTATRVMCVLEPVKLVITNFPENGEILLDIENNPEDDSSGTRQVPFSKELYIEREDFMVDPPNKYFRLAPGRKVRLKGAFIVQCDDYKTDNSGNVTEIHCTYFENSRSGDDQSGLKVNGTIHWVAAKTAVPVEVRLYDRLFTDEAPGSYSDRDFLEFVNPDSLVVLDNAFAEPALRDAKIQDRFQFLRKGYFCVDEDSDEKRLVFNRTVTLKDSWAKVEGASAAGSPPQESR